MGVWRLVQGAVSDRVLPALSEKQCLEECWLPEARIDAYMCSRLVLDAVSDSEMVAEKQHLE